MDSALLLPLALLIPLTTVGLTYLLSQAPNIRDLVLLFAGVALSVVVMGLLRFEVADFELITIVPNISIAFHKGPLGMIFALVASLLWGVTTLYSIGYMRGNKELHQTRFYMCFAMAIFAAMGIAFAKNLFTLFCFYELMTITTFPLVAHKGSDEARLKGRVYLGILMGSSMALLFPAMIWVYLETGTLEFTKGGILGDVSTPTFVILLVLFIYGLAKAALMPLHRWLPAAMVAPTPVSALLHAVAVVKAGVFSVVTVLLYIFGVDLLKQHASALFEGQWLLYMAGATIILASVVALKQDNLKRRLAYSTVSQLSYIILSVMILAPKSILAAAFHIGAHAVAKITLFFAAGSIYTAHQKTEVSQLHGIGRAMPWTMTAFAIASFSMIGLPPTVGFTSKWFMLEGAFFAESYFSIGIIFISTLLNAAYFLPIIFMAFFSPPKAGEVIEGEAPLPIVIALTVTALLTLGLFFYPDMLIALALKV